jgi:hypothetical protein
VKKLCGRDEVNFGVCKNVILRINRQRCNLKAWKSWEDFLELGLIEKDLWSELEILFFEIQKHLEMQQIPNRLND